MRRLFYLFIIVISMISCESNSPRKVAETMLKISQKGEFPSQVFTLEFEYYHSFDYDIYVNNLIPKYGKDALNMAEKVAEASIQLPNGIKSFEFVREIKQDSVVVRTLHPLQNVDGSWLKEDMKTYFIKTCNGYIDYKNKFVVYDASPKAAKTLLIYKLRIDGLNKEYIFSMICYFNDWKIYGITPTL